MKGHSNHDSPAVADLADGTRIVAPPISRDTDLRLASTDGLLLSYVALSNRLRRLTALGTPALLEQTADVREHRDAVRAEVLRRTAIHDAPLPDPRLPGMTHHSRDRLELDLSGE